jgi:predicted transcriptional regulator
LVQNEKQRSTLRICLDIIDVIHNLQSAKPTHILMKANLSHDRLTKYLEQLQARGLIEEKREGDSRFYVLTQKGIQFLIQMQKADEFVAGFGLSL